MIKTKNNKWKIITTADDSSVIQDISEKLGISYALATVIVNRGYRSCDEALAFIKKSQEILHDPFLLNDMDKAVDRIALAIEKNEKITIYGDYDADGVTSVSILYLYLRKLGNDVEYYIPSRQNEGYGVSMSAIDKICASGTKLIITVDTGITAFDEAEYAKKLGIDMVITDHHECSEKLPGAVAVINPKRLDSTYPFPYLAGVGVAFKLLCALEQRLTGQDFLNATRSVVNGYGDLTAIGTVADVMPAIDENRILISLGLMRAECSDKIGLATLIEHCRNGEGKATYKSKQKKKLTSTFVSFSLAPRINAVGRMSSASFAVDLFLEKDVQQAEKLSLQLCEINRERQAIENRIAEEARKSVEENGIASEPIIVLDNCCWHHGVIGIVSSRITERYGAPSLLISFEGNDDPYDMEAIGKGSGRSMGGMNLFNALQSCSDLLEKYGGHELAAGLTIKRKNLGEFRRRIAEYAKKSFAGADTETVLEIDCELEGKDINLDLATELCYLEPCGTSNPTPVFAMRNAVINDITPVGMNRHLKLNVVKDNKSFNAMLFSVTPQEFNLSIGDEVDIAFNLDINEFNGISSAQVSIKDIKPSERTAHYEHVNESVYEGVKCGESELDSEYIVPNRDDFGEVYNFLISGARLGKETFRYSRLLNDIIRHNSASNMNYVKLKYIIEVFGELDIVSIEKIDKFSFAFHMPPQRSKKNLDNSSILNKLKSMYPKR